MLRSTHEAELKIKVEPYWNVNITISEDCGFIDEIKVEPYWNVNIIYKINKMIIASIKVEPYWNVNIHIMM